VDAWRHQSLQHLFGPDYFPKNIRVVSELKAMAARYGKACHSLP
jgi:hypothetical protein